VYRYSLCAQRSSNDTYSGTYRFTSVTVLKVGALNLHSYSYTTDDTTTASLQLYADSLDIQMASMSVDRAAIVYTRVIDLEKTSTLDGTATGYYSEEGEFGWCSLMREREQQA
jgi:hypothetical protein